MRRQAWSLDQKIEFTLGRIRIFAEVIHPRKPYVAFSGGKDSTVLLDLVRQVYPDTPAVFVDTGLEYPEIREFVKQTPNVETLYPEVSFYEVIKKYGYPIVSKEVSKNISRYRNTKNPLQKEYRMWGTKEGIKKGVVGTIPKKWHYLIDAPFKISDKCCDVMKKNPFKKYDKLTSNRPIIGTMACESNSRKMQYMDKGCNVFDPGKEKSTPLGFWLEKDIWDYLKEYNIKYSKIYDMGEKRTGCMFCVFGCHLEKEPNRFQRMKKSHPQLYKYCMEELGLREVLEYMDVAYTT